MQDCRVSIDNILEAYLAYLEFCFLSGNNTKFTALLWNPQEGALSHGLTLDELGHSYYIYATEIDDFK